VQYGAIPTSLAERLALMAGMVPLPAVDTLFGMLKARCIMAGVRLGVFEGLVHGPRTAGELAAALSLEPSCLDLLLRSLAFCGYVTVNGDRYALSRLARQTMIAGAPRELTGFVEWNYMHWEFAGHLEELVRTGRGVDFHRTMTDPAAWANYQKAMLETARFDAPVLAKRVPVPRGATRLLDLGGSHGLLGAALCRKHPPLRSTVIDLPQAIAPARALAEREGHAALVTHRAGNVLEDAFGTGWHVALLANIVHHFSPAQAQDVLARVREAVEPNGTVAIWERERPSAQRAPTEGDGIALFFRLTSTAGAYSGQEYAEWLRHAGFSSARIVRPRLSPGSVLVHARR